MHPRASALLLIWFLSCFFNRCWKELPEDRPSFDTVYEKLSTIFDEIKSRQKDGGKAKSRPGRLLNIFKKVRCAAKMALNVGCLARVARVRRCSPSLWRILCCLLLTFPAQKRSSEDRRLDPQTQGAVLQAVKRGAAALQATAVPSGALIAAVHRFDSSNSSWARISPTASRRA